MNKQLESDLNELCSSCTLFSELSNSSVFVTGSTGLIGSLFIKALLTFNLKNNSNIKVYALCRSESKFKSVFNDFEDKNLTPIYSDILSINSAVLDFNIDYIVHGAAITVSKEMVEHCVETLDVAYSGTKKILEIAKDKNVKSVVYLSSMEAFGTPDSKLSEVTEKDLGYIDILSPRSSYSEGKRICETLCACYSSEYNVPVKIIRLAQTLGAGIDYNDADWEDIVHRHWNKNYIYQEYYHPYRTDNICFRDAHPEFHPYTNMSGLYVYNGEFAGIYSRLSTGGIISSQYNERAVATLVLKEENA